MPLGRRPLLALIVLPVLALAAGLLTLGAHAQPAPHAPRVAGANANATGCAQTSLKYVVTNDPREVERQQVFERTSNIVTKPGFYARTPPLTPTLHAASHGFVVVFYRPGLTPAQLHPLRQLVQAALATKAPVIVTPRPGQREALVALGLGDQLACPAATTTQTTAVRAFAAGIYPSLQP